MKKICILFYAFLMSVMVTKVSAATYDIAVENADGVTIYYNYINSGTEVEVSQVPNNGVYTGKVVIPETVTYEGKTLNVTGIGIQAFYKCYDLSSITIPNSVTTIGENAFNDCRSLTTVTIPRSVTTIGKNAFNACTGLTSVTIDDAATNIGNQAFSACTELISVELGNNVTSIEARAFYNCSKLPSITIPNSVKSIGDWAFYSCPKLMEVISLIKEPFATEDAFSSDNYNKATLYVPVGTSNQYKALNCWKKFKFIVEMTSDDIYLTLKDASAGCMKLQVKKGETYTVLIEPEEGWKLNSVTYNDENVTNSLDEQNRFTTPAITADAVLRVVFEQLSTRIAKLANDNLKIIPVSGGVWVEGAEENSTCYVFTSDGKMEKSAGVSKDRTFIGLPEGQVYIVNVGGKTLKVAL